MNKEYDVAIVGAGIAGCEAAWHCHNAGLNTLLVTTSLDTLYNLLGDGVVLSAPKETLMRQLMNIWQERHQSPLHKPPGWVSNWEYHRLAKTMIETQSDIHLLQSSVTGLLVDEQNARVYGVQTWEGVDRHAKRVALCVGSFLQARLRIGNLIETAGRLSEMAYDDLYEDLLARAIPFIPNTLKANFNQAEEKDADGKNIDNKLHDNPLSYTVDCQVIDNSVQKNYTITSYQGLYAAGVCASGSISYEAAALAGVGLGEVLVASF